MPPQYVVHIEDSLDKKWAWCRLRVQEIITGLVVESLDTHLQFIWVNPNEFSGNKQNDVFKCPANDREAQLATIQSIYSCFVAETTHSLQFTSFSG